MTQSMTTAELVGAIKQAGGCSHPIRLRGEFLNAATGEIRERPLLVACKDRRAVLCPACSYLYKADAWIVVSTGLLGGKGVPTTVGSHPRLFVTLTAPSFGAVHAQRADGSCHPRRRPPCPHGRPLSCRDHHDDADPLLGSPLCADCFNYRGAVLWNAQSSRLWNRTVEQVRRQLAADHDATGDSSHLVRLSYLKVAEFQLRGLVHFHVVLRADGADQPFDPPPASLTTASLARVITSVVAHFSVAGPLGEIAWGRQFHVSELDDSHDADQRVAAYLAKYAVKTTDGSLDFARRFHSRAEILNLATTPHLRRLALTTWDLGLEPELAALNLRAHAHALGFRGQLITKSRHYSTRFQDLRDVRAAFMATPVTEHLPTEDPVRGTFTYEGRGYDDPHAREVAEFLHRLYLEARHSSPATDDTDDTDGAR